LEEKQEGRLEEEQKSRGWDIVDWLKTPPEELTAFVYLLAVLLIAYLAYMIGLGLFAFTKLGHEIASGSVGTSAPAPAAGTGGSLTVFFTVLLALVGGPLAIWRVVTAHVQAQAARRQADIAREGQYTALFTKAVELLGATREVKKTVEVKKASIKERELVTDTEPNLEMRLGAIYALERIARDSERDYWPIMEVLCAYVRNHRNTGEPKPRPDGAKAGSDEFEAWLRTIEKPRVDVQAALTVIGNRSKDRVKFEEKQGFDLDLSEANLQGYSLKGKFARANLRQAHLEGAIIREARLEGASLIMARLEGANLSTARLGDASLIRARLEGASLVEAHLEGANLFGAGLEGANLRQAHLEGAHLSAARLGGASLESAHLEGANLFGAGLEGARLFGTDLSLCHGLEPDSLHTAWGDATTTLPEGMQRPERWPDRELGVDERYAWIEKARGGGPQV
jgi:uncharacterized protein YjbI with pentapeptide repeats